MRPKFLALAGWALHLGGVHRVQRRRAAVEPFFTLVPLLGCRFPRRLSRPDGCSARAGFQEALLLGEVLAILPFVVDRLLVPGQGDDVVGQVG
jgi:hypothetical protein